MRNKRSQEKQMRGYFIEAAKQILKGKGIDSLSDRNIANQAGYSYDTFYNYFNDITDIINECINDFANECEEYILEHTKHLANGPEKLRATIKAYVSYFLDYPNVFDVFFLEKINQTERKFDASSLITSLLDKVCKSQWNFLISRNFITPQNAEKAISLIRYQIPGLLLFYLNRNIPKNNKSFLHLFNQQLNKIILFETQAKPSVTIEENILQFIFDDPNSISNYYFIHYTREREVAEKIINEGFKYIESFHNSAEQVINDRLDLLYKHNIYKPYGNNIVILGISRSIFDKYAQKLRLKGINIYIENIFSEIPPEYNEEAEEYSYTLPRQFIKGFANYITGEMVRNPVFNPNYDSPTFESNLNRST